MTDNELVERCAAAGGRKVTSTLLLVLLSASACRCAESGWVIPYPPGGTPSKLWSADPRTRDWNGVIVYYALYADHVGAKIREPAGRRGFDARGKCWYESQNGEKSSSYLGDELTPVFVVRFGEKEERYIAGYDYSIHGRSLKLYEPAAHDEQPRLPRPGG